MLLISLVCYTAWARVCGGRWGGRRRATRGPFGAGGNSAGQRAKQGGRRGPAHRLGRSVRVLPPPPSGADVGPVSTNPDPARPPHAGSPLGDRGAEQCWASLPADPAGGVPPHRGGGLPAPALAHELRHAPPRVAW